uniref:DUF1279 domain-containing protein n=1 Tax=Anas platyrhynchos TaxID=8839 RepID=A0A8B9T114_ANAPL
MPGAKRLQPCCPPYCQLWAPIRLPCCQLLHFSWFEHPPARIRAASCSACFCAQACHPVGPCKPPLATTATPHPRAGPPLSPPDPLLALQAAGGSSAKDVGGSPEKAATDLSGENKKLNKSQQLNKVFKEYGAVGVSFHIGISSVSLGISYLAVSSGVDMTAVLCKLGFSESSLQSKRAAGTETFVITIVYIGLFKSPKKSRAGS